MKQTSKNRKQIFFKLLSMILVLSILLSMVTITALAENEDMTGQTVATPSVTANTVIGVVPLTSTLAIIDVGDSSTTSGTNWTYSGGVFTITGDVTITGTTTTNKVVVQSGVTANITLDSVSIELSSGFQNVAFHMEDDSTVTMNLAAGTTNTLNSSLAMGIEASLGTSLTINGTGILNATGDVGGTYDASGISSRGIIIINNGTINAIGTDAGEGIRGSEIIINGGTINASIKNDGYGYGDGIGGDEITINGGTVNAYGGRRGAGIGGNDYSNITISGNAIVTARGGDENGVGGNGGAGIGAHGGLNSGNITISGNAIVMAIGGADGAGIGGGSGGNGGTITINGGKKIVAIAGQDAMAGNNAMALGGGLNGTSGTVTVSNTYNYHHWNNTTITDPNGAGTSHPPTPFVNNTSYKYVRIEEASGGGVTTHTITYLPNGGNGNPYIVTVNDGDSHTVLDVSVSGFTRAGHSFVRWNMQADGNGTPYTTGVTIPNIIGNIDLYATWNENPTPQPSQSSGSNNSSSKSTTPVPVITDHSGITGYMTEAKIQDAIQQAQANGSEPTKTRAAYSEGHILIKPQVLALMKNHAYIHDTTGSPVQVRVRIPEPAKIKSTVYLCGSVTGGEVDRVRARFEKLFDEDVRVVDLHQQEPWGQTVKLAARVDFAEMDTQNLRFYSYNKDTNKYRKFETKYNFDENGYIHFTSDLAGAIVIINEPFSEEARIPQNPTTGGDDIANGQNPPTGGSGIANPQASSTESGNDIVYSDNPSMGGIIDDLQPPLPSEVITDLQNPLTIEFNLNAISEERSINLLMVVWISATISILLLCLWAFIPRKDDEYVTTKDFRSKHSK